MKLSKLWISLIGIILITSLSYSADEASDSDRLGERTQIGVSKTSGDVRNVRTNEAGCLISVSDADKTWSAKIDRTLNAVTLYAIPGGTRTSYGYNVGASSVTLWIQGGIGVGSTTDYYNLDQAGASTIGAFISSVTTQGNWSATLVSGCYSGQVSSGQVIVPGLNQGLATVSDTWATGLASTNTVTLTLNGVRYISVNKEAESGAYHILTDVISDPTFAGGTCNIAAYEGVAQTTPPTTSLAIKRPQATTAVSQILSYGSGIKTSLGYAASYVVEVSTPITAGSIQAIGYTVKP